MSRSLRYVVTFTFCFSWCAGCGSNKRNEPSLAQQVDAVQTERDPEIRARKLLDISAEQRALRDTPGAASTSSLALKAAEQIKSPSTRSEVLLEVAKQLADGGSKIQVNEAIESARVALATIDDRGEKIAGMISLAEAVLKMGERETAATIVRGAEPLVAGIASPEEKIPLQAALAAAQMIVVGPSSAEALLKSATDGATAVADVRARVRAQAGAAAAFYRAGRTTEGRTFFDAAVASSAAASDAQARGYALLDVVEALSTYRTQLPLGELTVRAETAANEMKDQDQRRILLQQIQAARSRP